MLKLNSAMRQQGFEAGKVPAFTSIGCYPVFYVVRYQSQYRCEDGIWCAKCCNETDDAESAVVACDANWEDPDLFCDQCNERIESAYAEDEAE